MNTELIQTWNYEDHRKLLLSRCNRFARRVGTDSELFEDEAHIAYVRAMRDWKPGSIKFASFMVMCIDRALKAFWGRWSKVPIEDRELTEVVSSPTKTFDLAALMETLSEDGKEAVRVAFEWKPKVKKRPLSAQRQIMKKALQKQGWTAARVRKAHEEVREALGT